MEFKDVDSQFRSLRAVNNLNLNSKLPAMASLIVKNAIIWTGDAGNPRATALAVKDGKLVAVGSDAEVEKQKGDKTEVIDAAGQFLYVSQVRLAFGETLGRDW